MAGAFAAAFAVAASPAAGSAAPQRGASPSPSPSPSAVRGSDPLAATVWSSGCVDHVRRQIQFLGGELTYILDVYVDDDCTDRLGSLSRIGGYELLDVEPGTEASAKGSWPLNFTLRSMSWTPASKRFVDAMNGVGECGIHDWKAGVSRPILGLTDVCYFLEAAGPWAGEPQLPPSRDDVLLEWVDLAHGELRISEGFGTRRHREVRTRELIPAVLRRD